MRKESTIFFLLLFITILSFLISSCDRAENCAPTTRNYFIVQFADSAGKTVADTLTITNPVSDSIFYDIKTPSTLFKLPLDPFHDTISYIFLKKGTVDWMKLGYRNVVNIKSEDCGPEFLFSELEILGTSYDSVILLESRMLDGVDVNIRIYHE